MITGLPGNGKTLYALAWLRKHAEKEGRTVYYSGIPDLRIPGWIEWADPSTWHTKDATGAQRLPKNSILLVDEAQRIFRPRMHGANIPEFVSALETHRHMGVDLVFITQHPMLIDASVRRLTGQHFHVIRKFGTKSATIHEWNKCKENCDKSRDDSSTHPFAYPKEVFELYKSAEAHTHKARIPFKVVVLFAMPFLLLALAYYAYYRLSPDRLKEKAPVIDGAKLVAPSGRPGDKLTPSQYVEQFQPRVAGLVHTAPAYDDLTKPTEAPYPAACVASSKRCGCYTQQGTVLDVSDSICRQIVEKGFFLAWKPAGAAQQAAPAPTPQPAAQNAPAGVQRSALRG